MSVRPQIPHSFQDTRSSLFRVVEDVRQVATAAVLAVVHGSHEDASTALEEDTKVSNRILQATKSCLTTRWGAKTYSLRGTLPPETLDLAIAVDLVVLEHRQFDLLALVLDLLWRGVDLLLALLAATAQAQHQVQRALLLDVVVRERAAVLELLAGEDQALLIRWDALLVCSREKEVVRNLA